MKLRRSWLGFVSCALLAAACGGGSNGTGTGGAAGTTAAAGTTGAAGTTAAAGTTGAAGTTAAAGTTGAAGTTAAAGTTGAAGTTAAAGTTGAAGRGGTTGSAGRGGTTGNAGRGGTTGNAGRGGTTGSAGTGGAITANAMMNFFVSSDTSTTANLGGLTGADDRCQRLAGAVGAGSKTWRAYVSAAGPPVINARDRIGEGPYYNSQGTMLAADKAALHARSGDAMLFIDERGNRINGQWAGSPTPNQHDILTGSTAMGMLMSGNTCSDWTGITGSSLVGHSDGLGPQMNSSPPYNQWAGSHTGMCGDTAPGGGAGRIYCFVGN